MKIALLALLPLATLAQDITAPPGFTVTKLRSAGGQEGSWVSLAVDDKGRFYVSPQEAIPYSGFAKDSGWGGIFRATLDAQGQLAAWDRVPCPIGGAMGMLWAFNSLYVNGRGPDGQAIYRLRDADGDGDLEQWTLFKKIPGGGGEHGTHALVLGPDHKIYISNGNSTPLVEGIAPDSPFRNYAEDALLPRIKDPVATFFDNLKSPHGHILRSGSWSPPDSATSTTSTSIPPATSSPTTATWSGTSACPGTAPPASCTSWRAASTASARAATNGPTPTPTPCPPPWTSGSAPPPA